jgi:N-acetylmuramoyl-L-alanine amidase
MVVLHYTAMRSLDAAADRLCDPAFEVSAHYLIGAGGQILRLVPEHLRAWHAGAGQWGQVTDVNSHSIGIELDNTGQTPFAAAQMRALEHLLPGILHRWSIPPERVIGHSDMAPRRKSDPGPRFDWARLARQGLAVALPPGFFWPRIRPPEAPEPATGTPLNRTPDPTKLHDTLTRIGYAPDLDPATALNAFRLRFRPQASGPADADDARAADYIATHFPVDRGADRA